MVTHTRSVSEGPSSEDPRRSLMAGGTATSGDTSIKASRLFIGCSQLRRKKKSISFKTQVIYFVEVLLSAQTCVGKLLVILVFLVNIATVIMYFIMTANPLEVCDITAKGTIVVDMVLNTFFIFYFGLRFIAASDKLKFWLELNSIVDFFTIPPIFVAVYLGRNWLGLRFLRALRLLELPKILQFLKIAKTSTVIKLSNLLAVFLSTWLTAAGFIHLLENTGDPWAHDENVHHMNYFECIYLLMVTMSTVGYGDITATTTLGRVFMIFFIVGGLVLFASHIPEIVDIIGSHKKYDGFHRMMGGRKHIVVCGYITLASVTSLLNDFLEKDRGEIKTEIIFLEEIQPNLELEAVFITHNIQTTFFKGSVLKYHDLNRVKMEYADACLVLANKYCPHPEHEDASNIMRVISIKNYYPNVRVIMQILQSHSKSYLQNIPNWDWRRGDSILCFSELKLGFMAQSCLVPGLSTVLINLCSIKTNVQVDKDSWQWHFLDSIENCLMSETLSNNFVGMTFSEVCCLCFVKMNIVLMAIEYRSANGSSILVNPSAQFPLQENTIGFFIARSVTDAKRASLYCKACHADIDDPLLIKKCPCTFKGVYRSPSDCSLLLAEKTRSLGVLPDSDYRDVILKKEGNSHTVLDSTGMFHWCKAVSLEQAILTHGTASDKDLHNHIVVSVFADNNSTLIGLRNFVMPLRTSNFTFKELKHIVFVGSLKYLKREWKTIQNFPKLFVFPGSGLSCANLRAVGIQECTMSTVLSSNWISDSIPHLGDTECILATLNIRSMQFKDRTVNPVAQGKKRMLDNKKPPATRIPVITELKLASNITFIQQNSFMDPKRPETKAYLTTPFASGSVFSGSFLDSLMATTYFNCQVLELLQTLVTGGTTPELEEQLAEENALTRSVHSKNSVSSRNRCILSLVSINDYRLSPLNENTYGDLFYKALTSCGIICFGLYRLMKTDNSWTSRYAITRPPNNFPLLSTDMLYCIVPYQEQPRASTSATLESLPHSSEMAVPTPLTLPPNRDGEPC